MATPSTPIRSASTQSTFFDIQKPLQFKWSDMPFFIRDYYSYMMGLVFKKDKDFMKNTDFKFYNTKNCLAFDFFNYAEDKDSYCKDLEKFDNDNPYQFEGACSPSFQYVRDSINIPNVTSDYKLNQLSMGSVIWLYYYEKMGIFKILGALLDDYNYKGKYTIKVKDSAYAVLMEHISILYRMGVASNLRDRVTLYEKTTGLSVDNNYGMSTTQNEGFMRTFDGILKQALEHYAYRRLDSNHHKRFSRKSKESIPALLLWKKHHQYFFGYYYSICHYLFGTPNKK
jgi:hypothetical protein